MFRSQKFEPSARLGVPNEANTCDTAMSIQHELLSETVHFPRSERLGARRIQAAAPAASDAPAHARAVISKGPANDAPRAASSPPNRAVAIRPPGRATALLRPEATPLWRGSTELSTAVVSGATAPAMPTAMTSMAGRVVD